MKLVLILFITCLYVDGSNRTYKRKLRVIIDNDAETNSYTVTSQAECFKRCTEDCVALSYTASEGRCKTFNRKFEDSSSSDISISTMFFYRTAQDCEDVYPRNGSGVYHIETQGGDTYNLYCDMETAGGPWNVIQNRGDGDVDFYRNWTSYKTGFGNLEGDFWLGNAMINKLTKQECKLLVQLEAWDGSMGYAEYARFQVADEVNKYKVLVDGFTGNTSNSFERQSGYKFSTFDQDNDIFQEHCAVVFRAGWWFKDCSSTNLNGPYASDTGTDKRLSMHWQSFFSDRSTVLMKKSRMLIKRQK
ncbi:angiopoietin-related protein 7-like [Mizuhopecten yessoensis]|uniref:angiopoietin-related protein 7-like n=1 Tax=Mizuhopecten yessoensis TaxID=6573 RepID=UPI000B45D43D|nr:angiopoietin-related protein 7-like [Mizuhopecten yessoensis]